jgi:uncharacterized protein YecE (DUF72 family)
MAAEIRIGTSGWHYKHWKGPFYQPDLPASKMLAPVQVTADCAYVRLHGPGGRYQGSDTHADLERWAGQKRLKTVYVYFDNDQAGYAPQNALELKKLIG